jgi:hypothetical protein
VAEHRLCRRQPLRLGPHANPFCLPALLDQNIEGLALQIPCIEERHRPVAHPASCRRGGIAAGCGCSNSSWARAFARSRFHKPTLPLVVHLGPQHMHSLAALAGEDPQRLGLGKAAPVGQG